MVEFQYNTRITLTVFNDHSSNSHTEVVCRAREGGVSSSCVNLFTHKASGDRRRGLHEKKKSEEDLGEYSVSQG